MKNIFEQKEFDILSEKYGKERVEQEVSKYQKQIDWINSDKPKAIFAIVYIVLAAMFLLSYKFQVMILGYNFLSFLPIVCAVDYFIERIALNLKTYLKNNIVYFSLYVLVLLSAFVAFKFNDHTLFIGICSGLYTVYHVRHNK